MRYESFIKNIIDRENEYSNALKRELRQDGHGSLYIKSKNGSNYFVEYRDGKQFGISKDMDRVYKLARLQYAAKRLAESQRICETLTAAHSELENIHGESGTEGLVKRLGMLELNRVTLSNKEWKWSKNYSSNPYYPEALKYATANGIKMRSKSERIIGNKLEEYNIPYRYEAQLVVGNKVYYPDFTILCPDQSVVLWEHCGLMDKEDYRFKTFMKIAQYRKLGFKQFENLICTWEEDLENMETLDEIIRRYVFDSQK